MKLTLLLVLNSFYNTTNSLQIVEKPEMENRCMQTDVNETRSVRQQTDEQETMNVMIQVLIRYDLM